LGKLIHFGQGYYGPAFLKQHLDKLEALPFDGYLLSIPLADSDKYDGCNWVQEGFWNSRFPGPISDETFNAVLAVMQTIKFATHKDVFLYVGIRNGYLPKTDDEMSTFASIVGVNAKKVANLAKQSGICQGLIFDVEDPPMWARTDIDATIDPFQMWHISDLSATEDERALSMAAGKQLMNQFQAGFPELAIFFTYFYGAIYGDTNAGYWQVGSDNADRPVDGDDLALYYPFLDGMLSVTQERTRLIAGQENAYTLTPAAGADIDTFVPGKFEKLRNLLLQDVPSDSRLVNVNVRGIYQTNVSVGFGLEMDRFRPSAQVWSDTPDSNGTYPNNLYQPLVFEVLVRFALANAEYVFLWAHRNNLMWIDVDSSSGGTFRVPPDYVAAVSRVLYDRNRKMNPVFDWQGWRVSGGYEDGDDKWKTLWTPAPGIYLVQVGVHSGQGLGGGIWHYKAAMVLSVAWDHTHDAGPWDVTALNWSAFGFTTQSSISFRLQPCDDGSDLPADFQIRVRGDGNQPSAQIDIAYVQVG
jgi:hypothetical protein